MLKIIKILFLITLCARCFGQNNDSLISNWQNTSLPDSSRIQAVYEYTWHMFLFSNKDSTQLYANKLEQFARDNDNKKGISKAYQLLSISNHVSGNLKLALDYAQKSLVFEQNLGDKYNIASTLNNIGLLHKSLGKHAEALSAYNQSLALHQSVKDSIGIANSYNNMGVIFNLQGNTSKALNLYLKSLQISELIGDSSGMADGYNNIGLIYSDLENYTKALSYHKKSLSIQRNRNNPKGIAMSLSNIGNCLSTNKQYTEAEEYFNKALRKMEEIGDRKGISVVLNNLGSIYRNTNKINKAKSSFDNSIKIKTQIEDKVGLAISYLGLGNLYLETKKVNKAILACSKAFTISKTHNLLLEQESACKCIYNAFKAQGNAKKALNFFEQAEKLKDSLKANETQKLLQQMEFHKAVLADSIYEMEKDRKIEESHKKEVFQKNIFTAIALVIAIFVLVITGFVYNRLKFVRKAKDEIENEKDRSEKLLLNILPQEIAEELKSNGQAKAREFELVTILFSDFKGFTGISEKLSAQKLVENINECFKVFDGIMEKYSIEKIKTIGDAYMAVGGLPLADTNSVKNTVLAAIEMQNFIATLKVKKIANNEEWFEMRLGLHSGAVVAGIVGVKKFQYDIWGDAVNTASRMESYGEVAKVNISEATYNLIKDDSSFTFEHRGKINAKGKGEIEMYFVSLA